MEFYSKPSDLYQHILSNKSKKYIHDGVIIQDFGLKKLISNNDWESKLLNRFVKYEIIDGYLDLNDPTFSWSNKVSAEKRSEGIISLLAFDTLWHKKRLKINNESLNLSFFISNLTKDTGHTLILKIENTLHRRAYNQIPTYDVDKMNNIYMPLLNHNVYYSFFKDEDDLFAFVMYYTHHLLYLGNYLKAKAFLVGRSLYGITVTEENVKYFLPTKIDYHHDPIKFLSLFQFVAKHFRTCKLKVVSEINENNIYKNSIEIPIFTYWDSGFGDIPWALKNIVTSHSKLNHDNFKLVALSHDNIYRYIDIPQHIEKIRSTYPANYSDYIRLALLAKYGGVWLDASIFVNKDDAISKIKIPNDDYLFAYYFSGAHRNISNFFMMLINLITILS